ncbi:phage tail tape measure protein [Paenibacillus ehimensis]|uniref:phage tail tape measure protein n=1 Tax=Paenibacillus ehimensis TaxID=79264 RepID=UPI000FDBF007|nr:phage tail tape measure protein [Paenibacillus ehimensis]
MAETIKGINVVIGSDTTGLSAALSDVNKKSKDIQSELKQVEQLLRLDPTNTELVAQKQKLLSDAVSNTSEKLDRLKAAQQQVADQFARGEISEGQYRAFQREIAKTTQELQSLENRLKAAGPELKSFGDKAGEVGTKLKESSEKFSGIGEKLSLGLTAPIAGIGIAAGKTAADVDAAAGKMQARLGLTAEKAAELSQAGLNIWKNGFGESLEEVNHALATTGQNIQGLDNASLSQLTQSALTLQQVFDADVNETTRTASVLMKNFGVDGQSAMDLITLGFQKGGDFSGELLDTLREYAPQFKALGISADDALGILIKGTESGAFNLDKVGDALKEFNIRIKDGSDSTSEALSMLFAPDNIEEFTQALMTGSKNSAEYMELLQRVSSETAAQLVADLQSGGKKSEDAYLALQSIMGDGTKILTGLSNGSIKGRDALVSVIQKLREIEDPIQQNTIGVALFGTQWEDLEKDVVLALDGGIGALGEFQGATEKAGQAARDNFGTELAKFWRDLQADLVPLGKSMLDMAQIILPPLIAAIQQLANWFSGLSPAAQSVVAVIASIAAAIGPALVIIGQLVSAVGSIMSAFSAASGAIAAAGGVMAALTGPIGIAIAAIGALAAGAYLVIKNWDTIKEFFTGLWDWIDNFFGGWGAEVTAALFPFLGIPLVIAKHWDAIKEGLSVLWDWIKDFFSKWGDLLIPLLAPFLAIPLMVVRHWEDIKVGLEAVWKWIKDTGVEWFNRTKEGFVQIWDGIKTYFSGVWDLIKNIFGGAILLIVDLVTGDFEKLKSDSEAIWNNLKAALGQIWEGIKKVFSGALSVIEGHVTTAWNAMKTVSTTIWDAIVGGIEKAIEWIKNLPSTMVQFGKDMIQGLIDGIKNMTGKVGDAIRGIADQITSGIRKALDIHSPSRVMETLGEYTGEGFAIGIGNTVSDVRQRASDMAAAASGVLAGVSAPSVQAAGASTAGGGGSIINFEGMFAGANINIRSDDDIRKMMREIWSLAGQAQRGMGGATV